MRNSLKLAIGIVIAFILIIGGIMTALSILKDEAVNNYLTISKLNAKSFSKELNQDIHNIEQTIQNISPLLDIEVSAFRMNLRLQDMQKNYPQIRSINVLKENRILYSSNKNNIGLFLNTNEFFPKPFFDEDILRVSTPWIGRDFINGNDVYNYEEKIDEKEAFFVPISKKINSKRGSFNVVVNLNNDYFMNRFLTNINSDSVVLDLIRLDGILLLSTDKKAIIGKKITEMKLLERTIEKSELTGIETINGIRYIITYILTDDYPINLAVKLNYEKSLNNWNKKQYHFFIITTLILIFSILISLFFFYLYNKKRQEEINLHKLQIQDQEKFRLLFQDSHFLAAVILKNGNIIDLNNSALEFLGKDIASLKGEKFWNLSCWKDEETKTLKKIFSSSIKDRIELELFSYDKNNNERIIDFSLSSIKTETEEIYLAFGLDITHKKEKEKILQQAYTVFDNTRDGIMITDKDTNLIDVNKAFEKITGYTKDEILQMKTNILKSNIHTKKFYVDMWKSILENGYWEGEITNLKKNKEEFTEWLTINTIYDENKEVVNYIGVFSDITEQKAKEKILKEKDEVLYQQSKMAAMGEMIENIAHQWRQPLSAISSAATGIMLQKEFGVSTQEDEIVALDAINKSSQYLSKTIDDFRNFLKVDKELKLFNLEDVINDAVSLSSVKLKSGDVDLVLEIESFDVYGIKNELVQVLINLISNAKDALSTLGNTKKYIFIKTYKKEQNIFIEIKDNAGGIPENVIHRIFEPYFTTKHKSQGTGIGLYMSEEIIKNHMEGTLYAMNEEYVYNEVSYKGASFIIKLPFK